MADYNDSNGQNVIGYKLEDIKQWQQEDFGEAIAARERAEAEQSEILVKAEALAMEIWNLARSNLLVSLRFLDLALCKFEFIPTKEVQTFCTNGKDVMFNVRDLLTRYKQEKTAVNRDYLHMVLHFIFQHPFNAGMMKEMMWDLSTDIAVEAAINELNLPQVDCAVAQHQRVIIAEIQEHAGVMTAEHIYRYFMNHPPGNDELVDMVATFCRDEHMLWYPPDKNGDEEQEGKPGEGNDSEESEESRDSQQSKPDRDEEDDEQEEQEEQQEETEESAEEDPDAEDAENEESAEPGEDEEGQSEADSDDEGDDPAMSDEEPNDHPEGDQGEINSVNESEEEEEPGGGVNADFDVQATQEEWQKISERVKVDLETANKQWGDQSGALTQGILEATRESYDYSEFLRRFAVLGEHLQVNDDEFDYIFYTYGLQLYENLPIVEPLEYKEVKKIRDFVIALDTSGSCSGEVVQAFVRKTYSLLKQSENFFKKINLHIIQCDTEIKSDFKVTCDEDIERFMRDEELVGFGGTDFRPVFSYVGDLIEQGEFTELKGLIYFTDGYGVFPQKKPPFETAFVFVKEGYSEPDVPPWAMKLVLEPEDILEDRLV